MEWIPFRKEDWLNIPNEVFISNGSYVRCAETRKKFEQVVFNDGTGAVDDVTHWMPFPKAPLLGQKDD